MKRYFLALCFLLLILLASAQSVTHTLNGLVRNTEGALMPYVSVSLVDSATGLSFKRETFTDENGSFKFQVVPHGTYRLRVQTMGFANYQQPITVSGDMTIPDIELSDDVNALGTVTVTARRRVLERKPDRFVMDVAASSFQGSTVLDIFQSQPFMQVQGEEFSINGKRSILVLLDNVQMPGMTVTQVLNSLVGSQLDRIEFITTPGARYDAGIDGVIHIYTKKGKTEGWTGTATANFSQGIHTRRGFSGRLDYRKEKWALGAQYSFSANDNYYTSLGYRQIFLPNREQIIGQDASGLDLSRLHNIALNVGYEISTNHKINMQVG